MSAPDEIPEGESVAEKLRLLQSWLIEDSDLPEAEVEDFTRALDAALEALESWALLPAWTEPQA